MSLLGAFSRTGIVSPLGKLDGWLSRQRIESQIQERLAKRAAAIELPPAEVLRCLARIAALGGDEAERMYGENVRRVRKLVIGMSDTGN